MEVNRKLSLGQGGLHGVGDFLFPQQLASELLIVDSVVLVVLPLDAFHRQKRPVAHQLHWDRSVGDLIDAPFHHHIISRDDTGVSPVFSERDAVFIFPGPFLQANKAVCPVTATDPGFPNQLAKCIGDFCQQAVSRRDAKHIIIQLEILHIGEYQTVFPLRILRQPLPHLLVKELLAVKPGKPVILNLADNTAGLPQLDKAGHPAQNHLGPIGLGHKVRGAMGQGQYLVFLAVALGGHDDRNQRQLCVLPDAVQEGIAVHHRHHQIQQDQGNTVLMLMQDIQRLLPVFRLQDPIAVGQHLAQDRPV